MNLVQLSVEFSRSVMSGSLWTRRMQYTRLPCQSPIPGACSNSCPPNRWCHPAISSSVILFSSYLQIFLSIRVFSNESVLHIRWPKYWSFSFSPSNEYSGSIPFRIDWFDLLVVQGTLKSLLQHPIQKHQFFSTFLGAALSSIHDYWGNYCFDHTDLGQQSDVSAF